MVLLWLSTTASLADEERIWLDAAINGKPVRLAFDTGTSESVLFSKTAERLGLKFNLPKSRVARADGGVPAGTTEECDFAVWGATGRITFATFEFPASLGKVEMEGLLGWDQVRSNIFAIDSEVLTVRLMARVPEEATAWTKLVLVESDSTLSLEIPGQLWTIAVDTGAATGVTFPSAKWREWKAANTNAPLTLIASYSPSSGISICEEAWANELLIGPLTLRGVPVRQASPIETARGQLIFGLAALKRLDCIIDGKQATAYLRSKRTPPLPYQHNRLGAEFVPRHSQSDELIAQVVEGSPAHAAGIRSGDILLKVGDKEMPKNWHQDQNVPRERWYEHPEGTKFDLTLKRNEETLKISVVLKDILLP